MLRIEGRRYAGKPLTFPTTYADSCSQSTSTASAPISYGSFPSTPHPKSSTLTPVPAWRSQPSPSARPGQYGRGQTRPGCSSPRSPAEQRDGQRCRPRTPSLPRPRRYQATAAPPAGPPCRGHRLLPAAGPQADVTSASASSPSTSRLPPRDRAAAAMFSEGRRGGGGSGGHLQRGQRGGPAVKWRRGAEGK